MPNYAFCNERGECFDKLFLRWSDAPASIVRGTTIYERQFPNPAVRFKGPFSGNTTQLLHTDDGSEYEPGVRDDQKQKKKDADDKREQDRTDFLAKQVSSYDL